MPLEPRIVQSPAQRIAMIHVTVPRARIAEAMDPALKELFTTIAAQGVAVAGPWFSHHLRRPTETFDFDICVPVSAPVAPSGRVQSGERRAARVIRAIHEGGYDALGDSWGALQRWIDDHGHRTADDFWEVYLVGPESGPDASKYRTELNRPLVD